MQTVPKTEFDDMSFGKKALVRLFLAFSVFSRGLTVGARSLVVDDERVLLVRHGFLSGWHLPGGGVEAGESVETALLRELEEETGHRAAAEPEFFGIYQNLGVSRRDHLLVYVVKEAKKVRDIKPDAEIAEAGWFQRDALPDGTAPETRRRVSEYFDGATRSVFW